ncbi:MAG TPA: class I SAM-dependent methyltransferase [Verrucomicrobiae bacterium]|jgi:2-polyprenyl-6-hydroxyphenyl methylase/3-demethylubiquinone-9 3-methyltransferase|nr:class I SAM-dependent methyltransferase [Verrucomicrobiae bacterium]
MNQDLSPTTAYFTADGQPFASNYERNVCFKDRLDLFLQSVQRTTPIPAKILDFGCGPGVISVAIAKLGYDVLGLDGSSGMIAIGRGKAAEIPSVHLQFDQVDAKLFDPSPSAFNAIICSSVIEYIEDDQGLLKKLIYALQPGGHLLLSVPHRGNVFAPFELLAHRVKLLFSAGAIRHLAFTRHRYIRNRLLAQLQQMGLERLRCTSFECPVLGKLGVRLSRHPLFGRMLLLEGQKAETRG